MNPIVKWPGGKRKIAESIVKLFDSEFNTYYEPFVGGAGVLLFLQPKHAVCFDTNKELINLYNCIKDNPEELIALLYSYFIPNHCREFYYQVRNWDRDYSSFAQLANVKKAARFLYLNKACYNGLWRVNSKGEYNVPMGRYTKPSWTTAESIRSLSAYLSENNISFILDDYQTVEDYAQMGDIVYFDPPYDLEEGQNGFVNYTRCGFNREDQRNLKELCDRLVLKGVTIGVSNSNTTFIQELYSNGPVQYEMDHEIEVNRSIGGVTDRLKKLNELFIIGRP